MIKIGQNRTNKGLKMNQNWGQIDIFKDKKKDKDWTKIRPNKPLKSLNGSKSIQNWTKIVPTKAKKWTQIVPIKAKK